jgi:subtilisin family serine protease
VISVAATRNNDVLAPFSNFGGTVSMTAPGDPVIGPLPGGGFGSARGTSFAAPIVSGAAALLRSVTPGMPMESVRLRLLETADNIDAANPGVAGNIGSGRLDAGAALGVGGPAVLGLADLNGDRRVDIEEIYLFHRSPRDLNGDGLIDGRDLEALIGFVRRFE